MKTKRWNLFLKASLLATALIFIFGIQDIYAQGPGMHPGGRQGQMGRPGPGAGMSDQGGQLLTDEQKAELKALVQGLKEQGATRDEIREAVDKWFADQGIEKPERQGRRGQQGQKPFGRIFELLNDEQKAELKSKLQELKEAGATREEVHNAVVELLESWDIEAPESPGPHGQKGQKPFGRIFEQLNDEQKAELKSKLQELKEAGATREEVHDAVVELLEGWGIEPPERPVPLQDQLTEDQIETVKNEIARLIEEGKTRDEIHDALEVLYAGFGLELPEPHFRGGQHRGAGLTDEQKETLKSTIDELKSQGASREEIRAAVDALFEEWGIERPERRGGMGRGHKGRGSHFGANLTEEQRQLLRDTVKALKAQGASREEIREAVKSLLDQWQNDEPEPLTGNSKIKARNYPNPFNPTTRITFEISEPGNVSLQIFNTQGQLIRTLVNDYRNEGLYEVEWNALDDSGARVPTGMYFYKITVGEETLTQRMLLMK